MNMFFSKRFSQEALFLLGISFVFFLLRFPSLYEPYWYGDEGIYFTIGKALHHGRELYTTIWDNKPPLLYWFYYFFNDLFSIRFVSMLFGIGTVVVFYLLTRELFQKKYLRYVTTSLFALLLAVPSFEGNIANAENFMLFPILLGALLFWHSIKKISEEKLSSVSLRRQRKLLLASGISLGIAFLFKTVAVFDFGAFVLFLFSISWTKSISFTQLLKHIKSHYLPFFMGFFIPFLLVCLLFLVQGTLPDFLKTIFWQNVSYVGENNAFLFPQGFLVMKLLLLITALSIFFRLRFSLTHKTLFILIWLVFSLFNTFFSQRPYIHYQLVMLPSLMLLAGLIPTVTARRNRVLLGGVALVILFLLYTMFPHWNTKKTIAYYDNFMRFVTGQRSFQDYQTFFDGNTPRDYAIADYLSLHREKNETIFLWGNSAQIYYLSETLPAGKYAVSYHIMTPQTINELQQVFKTKPPRFVVVFPDTETFPLIIPEYNYMLTIGNADIYEKVN